MENRPVINIAGVSPTPGADPEAWNRYEKWFTEVYQPLIYMKQPSLKGIDRYQIFRENPEYSYHIYFFHFTDIKARKETAVDPESAAVREDLFGWVQRRVIDFVYSRITYELMKGSRSDAAPDTNNSRAFIEKAPFIHLEGYRLQPEDREKYIKWLNDYGAPIFLPLLVRLPGLKGYDYYRETGFISPTTVREWEYPHFLSIIYFTDEEAFENYRQSPERLAQEKAIRNLFPNGLSLKWYVQYKLIQSWRK